MSISSHIDGKIDLEETLMARTLKELSERRRGCKECLLWQKRCTDCTLRYLLRQHLQGKRSPREFNEFLLKILNESSSEYRQKLVTALETWEKSSVYSYNKDSSLDFKRVVRQNKTKRLYGRNRRVLYKMENDNWCMVRKTPSVKITSMQPNNEKDKERIGCKSAEAMLQNFERKESCETKNNENFSNQEGHNIDSNDTLEYEKFVAELLNEGKDHMAPVFHPEFLKKLQDMPLDHAYTSETQFSETVRDYLQKLLNECERSEIYSSECILTDEDLLKYLENFIRNIRSSGGFDKLEQELLKMNDENLPEETFNEDKHDMENNIDICRSEIDSFQQHQIKDASAENQKKGTLSSKPDGHIDKDCRDTSSEVKFTSHSEDTSNESSEFSDNEFY